MISGWYYNTILYALFCFCLDLRPFCLPAEMLLEGVRLVLALVAGLCAWLGRNLHFLVEFGLDFLFKVINFRWLPPSTCKIFAYRVPEAFSLRSNVLSD